MGEEHAVMIRREECSLREESVVKDSSCMPKEKQAVRSTIVQSSKDEMYFEGMLVRKNIEARKAFKLEGLKSQGWDWGG